VTEGQVLGEDDTPVTVEVEAPDFGAEPEADGDETTDDGEATDGDGETDGSTDDGTTQDRRVVRTP